MTTLSFWVFYCSSYGIYRSWPPEHYFRSPLTSGPNQWGVKPPKSPWQIEHCLGPQIISYLVHSLAVTLTVACYDFADFSCYSFLPTVLWKKLLAKLYFCSQNNKNNAIWCLVPYHVEISSSASSSSQLGHNKFQYQAQNTFIIYIILTSTHTHLRLMTFCVVMYLKLSFYKIIAN